MWKKGLWSIVGGNVWKIVWRHYGKQYGGSSMKNSEGSYQTIQLILLLSIYQKEMKSVSQSSVLLCSLQHYSQLLRYRNKCLLINEWTGWISLQSKGLARVFSNTTVQKHQFFGAQLSSQSNSHIHTQPLEKP